MSGKEIKFKDVPWGLCPACLKRMQEGVGYRGVPLRAGGALIVAYCEHREVGAILRDRPGGTTRWHITTPIDALEWEELVRLQVATINGYQAGLDSDAEK
jgi:hypothetical protein